MAGAALQSHVRPNGRRLTTPSRQAAIERDAPWSRATSVSDTGTPNEAALAKVTAAFLSKSDSRI